jgi:hypothetical protein
VFFDGLLDGVVNLAEFGRVKRAGGNGGNQSQPKQKTEGHFPHHCTAIIQKFLRGRKDVI